MRKKKLIEATKLWLSGNLNSNDSGLEENLKAWGLSAEQISPFLQAENTEPEFKLFPENLNAWNAFLIVSTQFVVLPMGGFMGLNYPAVDAGLRMAGLEVTPLLFGKIRIIESVVVEWSRKSE